MRSDVVTAGKPLEGARVALLFQNRLRYSTRFEREVRILRDAGARVSLISVDDNSDVAGWFESVCRVEGFEFSGWPGDSCASWRHWRAAKNSVGALIRRINMLQALFTFRTPLRSLLEEFDGEFDIYWAVDVMPLASAVLAARRTGAAVVYETIDLVPEYKSESAAIVASRLRSERLFLPKVASFVTAGAEYANYYRRKYGRLIEGRGPVVMDNFVPIPDGDVSTAHEPRRMLFFGNLAPDRPLELILRAYAQVDSDSVLTIQGRDLIGGRLDALVNELGLGGRVFLRQPCEPSRGAIEARKHDIGIVALAGIDENERRAPTAKVFTYLAGGLHLLAADLPGIRAAVGGAESVTYVAQPTTAGWVSGFRSVLAMTDRELSDAKRSSLERARRWPVLEQEQSYIREFDRARLQAKVPSR